MQAQYNYDAHRTSNPLYVGISKLAVIGETPVSFGIGGIYYLSSIPGGAACVSQTKLDTQSTAN
jgi:hypothetical protein